MKNEINSLQSLREQKMLIARQLEEKEAQIKYDLYLYSHPVEWATNALITRNTGSSAENLKKIVSFSRRVYSVWKVVSKVIKLLRKA
jgi:hypothetical protein